MKLIAMPWVEYSYDTVSGCSFWTRDLFQTIDFLAACITVQPAPDRSIRGSIYLWNDLANEPLLAKEMNFPPGQSIDGIKSLLDEKLLELGYKLLDEKVMTLI